jgi:small subunit ribosomal protein S6
MPKPAAYDLFVLLDLESPDERRASVIDQVRRQLHERGTLKGDVDWGTRKLAYEIDHRGEAQYHLFQFEAAPELLSELDRSLSIEDAVIRHRIIRLPGEAPDTPPKPAPEEPRRMEDRDRGRGRGPRSDSPDEAGEAPQPAADDAAPAPESPAEPAPAPETPVEPAPAQETVAAEQPAGDSSDQG